MDRLVRPRSGPWSVSAAGIGSIRRNREDCLSASLQLDGRSSVYYTLFGASGDFARLGEGEGHVLEQGTALAIDLDVNASGTAQAALMVLEFNEDGERIGTRRARAGRGLLYPWDPNVARFVVLIRCWGKGKLQLKSVRVRTDPDFYASLARHRFGADDPVLVPVGDLSPTVEIAANGARSFVFPEVPAGEWQVQIQHKDGFFQENRRSLVGRVALAGVETHRGLSGELGLARCSRGHPFSYLGGGRHVGRGQLRQSISFNLEEDQRAIVVQLSVNDEDHDFELQSLILISKEDAAWRARGGNAAGARDIRLAHTVRQWLDDTPLARQAPFVLYADIDLNSVDGSSVWLSSIASMLCAQGPCILVAKADVASDVVLNNIRNRENLVLLEPGALELGDRLNLRGACQVVRFLDDALPDLRHVVVRGLAAAADLAATRRFKQRLHVYLTDFYSVGEEGLQISEEQAAAATLVATHAATILTQTGEIAGRLREVTGQTFRSFDLPPAIPDDSFPTQLSANGEGPLRIGYAGKINPQWGVVELLEWTKQLRGEGVEVELDIAANKISGRTRRDGAAFREQIADSSADLGVQHHTALDRAQSMSLMAQMDFVWCWRPASLEDHTLELSTKLVEMAANGARCICYPNAINRALLGDDYPFFVRDLADLRRVLEARALPDPALAARIREAHGVVGLARRLAEEVFAAPAAKAVQRICFAGHDFKFIDPYVSRLKAAGHHVIRDVWNWGEMRDPDATKACADWADTVFCEWGLANAVWYSRNRREGQRIFIRVHLQEINERARKFSHQIDIANIEKVVFVSERVRDTALEMFGWPADKTIIIPNFVLSDEYGFAARAWDGPVRLGMVGIVPERKRFDRAVDLLIALRARGHDAELHIKGPRPETLAFMQIGSRAEELGYYEGIYARIAALPGLEEKISFAPWGNDVSHWYGQVDHILSCSDFESFHYALADGVLSGCQPLVWPWDEAADIYTPDWIVADNEAALASIEAFRAMDDGARSELLLKNRAMIVERYGHEGVFAALDAQIGVESAQAHRAAQDG